LGTEAVYQYDKNGKLLSVDFAGPGISVKRSYDSLGRELTYSDSLGTINTKTYDKSGNILTETDAGGNSVVCKYDAFNRITKKTFMDGTWQTYRYNNKGVIDQITSSNGSVTDFTFDDNGRIISSTDPRGIYSVTYDEQGNVATRTDPNENTTSYEYDKMNRVIKETYPDSSVKTFTYYPEGQLKSVKDRKGNTVQYEYNELGLLTKRNFPGDNDDVFTYSGRGQVLTAANKNATVSYIYDNEGRVIQETLNGQTTSYSYDLNNKKMQITYPGGRVITEYYDVRGRLAKLSGSADGDIATFTYNLNDEPKQTDYKNGTTVAYTFANARPTGITHKLGQNSPFLGYNLTYKNGQIEKETRTDNKNRDKSYTYDVMGRLTNSVQGNRTDNYTLDGVDNWLDFNGEKRTVNKLNQYTSINSVNYQYDLNGNLTEDSNNKYEYDYMNRLTKVTGKSDAKVSEYKYDALGRRTSVTSGGVTTNYFYNLKIQVIEEQVNGAVSATYVVGNRPDIYSMNRNGKTYYYHQDIRGSVMRITDNSGKVVEEYEYDAYGNTNIYDGSGNLISVSAIGNFYGFTGAMFDSDTGLYFMINRYYSPYLGRFVSADPLGYVDGGNLYGYASLDPINYIDLLGLSSEQCSKMGFDYSLGGDLSFLLQSIKIGIKGSGSKASIKLSIEECRKECCKNGKITQSPIYIKEASLEGNWKMSEELPVPSLSFYIPVLGKIGVFATVDIYIKGSGSYKEIVNKDCEIEIGVAKACVEIGGSIGVKAGLEINISKIQGKASLSGKASPSGQVCYGKEGWEILICAGANISAEASVKITYTWWSVSKSYNWNVLTAQMCYVRNAKGSYISGTLKSDIFGEITQKQPI